MWRLHGKSPHQSPCHSVTPWPRRTENGKWNTGAHTGTAALFTWPRRQRQPLPLTLCPSPEGCRGKPCARDRRGPCIRYVYTRIYTCIYVTCVTCVYVSTGQRLTTTTKYPRQATYREGKFIQLTMQEAAAQAAVPSALGLW